MDDQEQSQGDISAAGRAASLGVEKRILVIEDDPNVLPILAKVVRRLSAKIRLVWLSSAEAHFDQQSQRPGLVGDAYDLVLTDIRTDGVATGYDVWSHFARTSPKTPVVLMSNLSRTDFYSTIGAGAVVPAYLEKPADPDEVRVLVESILAQQELWEEV